MPFKSKAQRRKFAQLLVEGRISDETYEEWNRETGRQELPERVTAAAKTRKAAKKRARKRVSKQKATKRTAKKKKAAIKRAGRPGRKTSRKRAAGSQRRS